jgi:hypothetical protein
VKLHLRLYFACIKCSTTNAAGCLSTILRSLASDRKQRIIYSSLRFFPNTLYISNCEVAYTETTERNPRVVKTVIKRSSWPHANTPDVFTDILVPANQNGCITLCVGNLADEKFQAFYEVSRMKFLRTVVHRLTELLPNHCQHRGNLYHNYIFK